MAELRWRANLLSETVDEIEIVSETEQYVDVRSPARGGWAGSIRREAKATAYSRICKTRRDAWLQLLEHARHEREIAKRGFDKWTKAYEAASAVLTDIDAQQTS